MLLSVTYSISKVLSLLPHSGDFSPPHKNHIKSNVILALLWITICYIILTGSEHIDGVLAKNICLSGLASQGKVLLPVKKTPKQAADLKQAARKRGNLLEAARRGDTDAIETLTVEDMDLYSMVTRRIIKEDMYSIIETSFMPSGIECDQYSIIGNILSVNLVENELTKEEIYRLRVECNDIVFTVAINKADLLGEPAPGRRFKGQIWMQGLVDFGVNDMLC